jgi:hypothetical protein
MLEVVTLSGYSMKRILKFALFSLPKSSIVHCYVRIYLSACEVPKMSSVCLTGILFSVLHKIGYCFLAKRLGMYCQKCYKMSFLGGASRETEQ